MHVRSQGEIFCRKFKHFAKLTLFFLFFLANVPFFSRKITRKKDDMSLFQTKFCETIFTQNLLPELWRMKEKRKRKEEGKKSYTAAKSIEVRENELIIKTISYWTISLIKKKYILCELVKGIFNLASRWQR